MYVVKPYSLITCVALLLFRLSWGQHCSNKNFGENDPNNKRDNIDTGTAIGYMVTDNKFTIDCCGVTKSWEAYFDNISGSRTVYFQIWRPPTSGTTYTMVGEYGFTVTNNGEQSQTVPQSQRVTIKDGDYIGWWTDGTDAVAYKNGGTDGNFIQAQTDLSAGDPFTWTVAIQNDISYAVRLDVTASTPPNFGNLDGVASIVNSEPIGTSVFTVSASDVDPDDNAAMTITMTANSKFSFNSTTGVVSTAVKFVATQTVVLSFDVTDLCGKSDSGTLTITITNEAPEIKNLPYSVSLSEDTLYETLIYTLNITDSATPVAEMTCSLPTGTPFTVHQVPGTTDYGVYCKANPGFDYDTTSNYDLSITCSDGDLTVTKSLYVFLVKNNPPVFQNLQNATVLSTNVNVGYNVFTVISTDVEGDSLSYTMTCDPDCAPFEIFDSGAIQVKQDLTGHTIVGYDFNIWVSDGRSTVGPEILTVTFSDINDPVTITNLPLSVSVSVPENSVLATPVFTVSIQDVDAGQAHSYTLTSSPAVGTSYFAIDSSGVISTASNILDYEALGSKTFTFTVTVSDPVTSDSEQLVISINDVNEPPSFAQDSFTLSTTEGTAGSVIGTPNFNVDDDDASDTTEYTMNCGANTGYVSIGRTSGQVTFQSTYDLDTGSLPTIITCTVTVRDKGGLTDTATLIININDANDNIPLFSPTAYSFFINYYAPAGTVVGKVSATDGDSGTYGVLSYSLDQTSLSGAYFTIDNTGQISLTASPANTDLGFSSTITIKSTASDIGGLSDDANVVIVISGSTTTSTTTTTDRYRNFMEDSKNIAWLIACIVVLCVIVVLIGWITCSCKGQNSCSQCRRMLCKKRFKPRRRYSFNEDRYRDFRGRTPEPVKYAPRPPPPPPPKPMQISSIRVPPPPKALQAWRHLP